MFSLRLCKFFKRHCFSINATSQFIRLLRCTIFTTKKISERREVRLRDLFTEIGAPGSINYLSNPRKWSGTVRDGAAFKSWVLEYAWTGFCLRQTLHGRLTHQIAQVRRNEKKLGNTSWGDVRKVWNLRFEWRCFLRNGLRCRRLENADWAFLMSLWRRGGLSGSF